MFNLVHTNTNFSPNGKVGGTTSSVSQGPFVSGSFSNNVTQPSTEVSKLSHGASDFAPATSIAFSSSNGHLIPVPSQHAKEYFLPSNLVDDSFGFPHGLDSSTINHFLPGPGSSTINQFPLRGLIH